MRTELAEMGSEKRHIFYGTFERKGSKHGYKGPVETLLLIDVKDENGNVVAKHLWFNMTKGFAKLNLKQGDIVKFEGRIEDYERGYFGRKEEVYVPESYDYKISRPTKVTKVDSDASY